MKSGSGDQEMPPHGLEPKGTPASISVCPHNRKAEEGQTGSTLGQALPTWWSSETLVPVPCLHPPPTSPSCLDRLQHMI
ncbi:Cullin-9 [Manis pentadactyla]|nr:Cullin-9 [Manis pentadactyla]